jgi:ubiquinone/menaquinone biosynthesis C-methylase UbiE
VDLYTNKYGENVGGASGYAGFRNRRRLHLLSKLIPVTTDDQVLEIGPNTCLLMDAFKEKAKSIIGIDINEEVVSKMNRSDLVCMDAANMAFDDASFNIVMGIEVFEHIPALQKVFSEIDRVLISGGKCYMTVPFELFRGQQALGDAWHTYRDLRMARQLHVHQLNPKRIKKMIAHTTLEMIISKLIWIPGPSYFIVLQKK